MPEQQPTKRTLAREDIHPDVLEAMKERGHEPPAQAVTDIDNMLTREIHAMKKHADSQKTQRGPIRTSETQYWYLDSNGQWKSSFMVHARAWLIRGALAALASLSAADKVAQGSLWENPSTVVSKLEQYMSGDELEKLKVDAHNIALLSKAALEKRALTLQELSSTELSDSMRDFFHPRHASSDPTSEVINFAHILEDQLSHYAFEIAKQRVLSRLNADTSSHPLVMNYLNTDPNSTTFKSAKATMETLFENEKAIVFRELGLSDILKKFEAMQHLPPESFDGPMSLSIFRQQVAETRNAVLSNADNKGTPLLTTLQRKYELTADNSAKLQTALEAISVDSLVYQMMTNCVTDTPSLDQMERLFDFMLRKGGTYFLTQLPPLDPSAGKHRLLLGEPYLTPNTDRSRIDTTVKDIVREYVTQTAEAIAQGLSTKPTLEPSGFSTLSSDGREH